MWKYGFVVLKEIYLFKVNTFTIDTHGKKKITSIAIFSAYHVEYF